MIRPLLFALQLALAQAPQPAHALLTDSVRLRARVDSAIRAFQTLWADDWISSQSGHPLLRANEPGGRERDERMLAVHCHWPVSYPVNERPSAWVLQHMIRGSVTAHATCPRFVPPDVTNVPDERRAIDNGLDPRFRLLTAARRQRLRVSLDSAAQLLPGDIYLAGQRVRFALDAGDFRGAVTAALSCGYDPAQCALLQGLILYRLGDAARADSTFAAAASLMSPDRRCEWNDVRVLLDGDTRAKYERMSCAERAEVEARLWWLSDPLWVEPGNERRAEHFARKVTIGLLTPLGSDGRQYFTASEGGEAVIASIIRYGWPTQMFWGGPDADFGHDQWLMQHGAVVARPYAVREYSRAGRLHTVPLPATLDDPFVATRDGWQLTAPDGDVNWWPREHYARDASAIEALPAGQAVMLRRHDSTRFVWAGALDSAECGRTVDPRRRLVLFDSRSVGDVKQVASFTLRGPGEARAIVDAALAPGRTLLGIELPGDSTHAAARTRFGIDIDEPLSALHGAPALSQPLLFDAPADPMRTVNTDQAIDRMYTTTTLRDASRIGVYWEAYGFAPADTLDVAVAIARVDQPNAVMRAIRVLGIGESGGNDVAIRWREAPGSSRAIDRLDGEIPIELRSIVIDVSRLPHGSYVLRLAASRPGRPAVTSERRIELR